MSNEYVRLGVAIEARLEVAWAAAKGVGSVDWLRDPADPIRRYERDMAAWRRHRPHGRMRQWCGYCYDAETGEMDWPCPEYRDLLNVYPEVAQ